MGSLKSFKVDDKKVENGVWCDLGNETETQPGTQCLIARLPNKKYEAYLAALVKMKGPLAKDALFKKGLQSKAVKDGIVECILLDWKNLTEEDGTTEIPYSKENARRVIDQYPEFYDMVLRFAGNTALFKDEEDLGNSSSS